MGKKVYQTFEILATIMAIVSGILFGLTFGKSAENMSDNKKESMRIAAVVLFVTGILLGFYSFRMV